MLSIADYDGTRKGVRDWGILPILNMKDCNKESEVNSVRENVPKAWFTLK